MSELNQAVIGIGKGAMTRFTVILHDGTQAEVSVAFERDCTMDELRQVREDVGYTVRSVFNV